MFNFLSNFQVYSSNLGIDFYSYAYCQFPLILLSSLINREDFCSLNLYNISILSLKISFPPFILELFLWENVLEEESQCTLTDTEAIFSLQKASVPSDWPSLEVEDIDKVQKRDFRNQALEKAQSVFENRAKSKSGKFHN